MIAEHPWCWSSGAGVSSVGLVSSSSKSCLCESWELLSGYPCWSSWSHVLQTVVAAIFGLPSRLSPLPSDYNPFSFQNSFSFLGALIQCQSLSLYLKGGHVTRAGPVTVTHPFGDSDSSVLGDLTSESTPWNVIWPGRRGSLFIQITLSGDVGKLWIWVSVLTSTCPKQSKHIFSKRESEEIMGQRRESKKERNADSVICF